VIYDMRIYGQNDCFRVISDMISHLIGSRVETRRFQATAQLNSTCTAPHLALGHHALPAVAVQVAFERQTLKPVFHLIGARVETTWVPGAFQLWVRGSQQLVQPHSGGERARLDGVRQPAQLSHRDVRSVRAPASTFNNEQKHQDTCRILPFHLHKRLAAFH
jgi:hypothetical protein